MRTWLWSAMKLAARGKEEAIASAAPSQTSGASILKNQSQRSEKDEDEMPDKTNPGAFKRNTTRTTFEGLSRIKGQFV